MQSIFSSLVSKKRPSKRKSFFSLYKNKKFFAAGILLVLLLCPDVYFLKAEDYSSTDFILRDPVISVGGGRSTSTSFESFSSLGQVVGGESTSTSFISRSGLLYFPFATSPTVSATAGNAQVDLSWTSSIGTLANVTTYQLGTSTTSGGSFTF